MTTNILEHRIRLGTSQPPLSWSSREARQATAGFFRQRLAYYTPTTHFMAIKSTARSPPQPQPACFSNLYISDDYDVIFANFGTDYVAAPLVLRASIVLRTSKKP